MRARKGNRVLMLLENARYPQDRRVRLEAQTLLEAGCEVTVICPGQRGQPWRETLEGVHIRRFPQAADGNGLLGYLWEYGYSMAATFALSLFVFFERGFDIVHAHNPPDFFVLIAAFYKLFGKRFVFDHHDLAPEMYYARFGGKGNRIVHRVLVFFERLSCRLADHVIATNESYKVLEQQRSGIAAERITVVRNGAELEWFEGAAPDPEIRNSAGTVLCYVGIMAPQDGVDNLLKAMAHLIQDLGRTDVCCVLVGDGEAWESLRRLASEMKLGDHVRFPGFISHERLGSYLAAADIFVAPDPKNPYTDRSTMIKMMEYMAVGKPIVAFDLTEHRVTAESAALYARANDALEFARQIVVLMDDPALGQRMGAVGKHRIVSHLAWTHQKKHLVEVYRTLNVLPVKSARPQVAQEHLAVSPTTTPR